MSEEKKYPKPVVGAIIYNDQGEILLGKSPKWRGHWQMPGGKVELGETMSQALKREIFEETGLEISDFKLNGVQDCVYPELFEKKVHFIFIDYSAKLAGGELKPDDRENDELIWIKPEEALQKIKLNPYTKAAVEKFIENKSGGFCDLENKYKRALADYQNLLKQTAKEKMEFAAYANEQMLKEILPVYDHLKMALEHHNGESTDDLPGRQAGWLAGVQHVVKQFKDVLNKIGVEEINAGQEFDHNTMEAIGSEECDDEKLDCAVVKQVKAGYKLNGKIIEPAKVIVYKKK
ncbi:MAG: nucleotide exchange factor GrpE [bacterium]|nr:nucleotide exchange factor GrpE [bacterium]